MPPPNVQIVFGAIDQGLAQSIRAAQRQLEGLKATVTGLAGAYIGFRGLESIGGLFSKAIESAAGDESMIQQLRTISGSAQEAQANWAKLVETEGETAIGRDQLAVVSRQLMETGASAAAAADMTERLAIVSRASGESLSSIALAYEHIAVRGEATIDDLFRLSRIGIPAIGQLAQEFFNAERSIKQSNLALQEETRQVERSRQETEAHEGAFEGLATKVGLTQAAFQAWARNASSGTAQLGGLLAGMQGQAQGLQRRFSEGMRQIEDDLGVDEEAVTKFYRAGVIGANDLLDAAKRYREEQDRQKRNQAQDEQLENQRKLLTLQQESAQKVKALIDAATGATGPLVQGLAEAMKTWNGMVAELQVSFNRLLKDFGQPLMEGLKPALQAIRTEVDNLGPAAKAVSTWLGNAALTFTQSIADHTVWDRLEALGTAALIRVALIGGQAFNAIFDTIGEGERLDRFAAAMTKAMFAAGAALAEGAEKVFADSPIGQLMRAGERLNTPSWTQNYQELHQRNRAAYAALPDDAARSQADQLAKRFALPGENPDEIAYEWALKAAGGYREAAQAAQEAKDAFKEAQSTGGDVLGALQRHFTQRFNDPAFQKALADNAKLFNAATGQPGTSFEGIPAGPGVQAGPAVQEPEFVVVPRAPKPIDWRTYAGNAGDPDLPAGGWGSTYGTTTPQWLQAPAQAPAPPSVPEAAPGGSPTAGVVPGKLDDIATRLDKAVASFDAVKDLLGRVLSGGAAGSTA